MIQYKSKLKKEKGEKLEKCFLKVNKVRSLPSEAADILDGTPLKWPCWLIQSRALR